MIKIVLILLITSTVYSMPLNDNIEMEVYWVKIKDIPSKHFKSYYGNLDKHQVITLVKNLGEEEIPYPKFIFHNVPQNVCSARLSIRIYGICYNMTFSREHILNETYDLFSLDDTSVVSLLADGFYTQIDMSLTYTYKTNSKILTTPNILRDKKDILNRALFVQSHIDALKKTLEKFYNFPDIKNTP